MKHLPEEKTGLRQEIKLLSLFFFLFTADVFTQIPINGFCKLNSFQTQSGFTSLSVINFNKDSYSDLLLFKKADRKAVVLEGYGNGEFKDPKSINFSFQPSYIEPVYNDVNEIEGYAAISRSERLFGIISFTNSGYPAVTANYKFTSYPGKISIADVDGDGKNEFLISGNAFEGLSVLSLKKNKINESKLVDRTSFSFAWFVDLNNNGFIDIAAYNLFNSSVHFFYNDGEGNFTEKQKIQFNITPKQFKIFDLNFDSLNDFVFGVGNSIQIYHGNIFSTYNTKLVLNTSYPVDEIVLGDLNNDGLLDIVYLSKDAGVVSTFFGKDKETFHKELIQLKREGLTGLSLYSSNSIKGIAYLTTKGEVGYISTFYSVQNDFDLALSAEPSTLKFLDSKKNKINDLLFIDKFNNSLNLITRNNSGIPDKFYSINLFGKHKYLEVDDDEGYVKRVYCFSGTSRLIEIVTFDILSGEISKNHFYAPGNLVDLKIVKSGNDNPKFQVLYKKENDLFTGEYNLTDNKYLFNQLPGKISNIVYANLIPASQPVVAYWKFEDKKLDLIFSELNVDKSKRTILSVPVSVAEIYSDYVLSEDGLNFLYLSFVQSSERTFIVIADNRTGEIISTDKQFSGFRIKDKNHLSFNGLNDVFFYDEHKKSLRKAGLSKSLNSISVKEIFTEIDAADFIIKNLDFHNEHLIFSNKKNGSISIKRLSK